ncbi:bifunctional folylpolyglutamate synthase/dihydrofolate synthase [Lapidilactobacillus bayanensis]|uniref:bifunctional folylpolyglutamate synthase/dihydrofolate synthase n=1 Tax=Lapidilactobacillus bayanensis TaxID=2485998 RepID=UPI0013DD99F4|nr:folylpolyglutamate synthase/dihydrofolate synthase family protein [Lapidilactobacillus bayanensis]
MFTTIDEALSYIHSRPKFQRTNKLTLMKQALSLFANPQNTFPSIHVTGTNGKGSVSHLVSEILEAHGYRVGLFTSPFILRFNERIQLNNQQISDADLLALVNQVKAQLERVDLALTEFELDTVLMFVYFAQQKVDVGVIEVGIGGAHDRTNVINAMIGVIASIGMDHEQIIGPTLADIAREKAGIIKTGQTTILGKLPEAVQPIITEKMTAESAQGLWLGQQFQFSKLKLSGGTAIFNLTGPHDLQLSHLQMPALAEWQVADASLAIVAATEFLQKQQAELDVPTLRRVLRRFNVAGRMELLSHEPLILIDGAHNTNAISALIQGVKKSFPGKNVYLTMGMMADKDIAEVADLLAQTNWQVTWTTIPSSARAATVADLHAILGEGINSTATWQESLQREMLASGGDGLYLFAGSFYLITDVRRFLLANQNS